MTHTDDFGPTSREDLSCEVAMLNAVGQPQHVLILGGTSDIGLAIAEEFAARSNAMRVTLAARASAGRDEAAARLRSGGCDVAVVDFEALSSDTHAATVEGVEPDIDVAVVAFGVLGDQERAWTDVDTAAHLAGVNYLGAVTIGVALGRRVRQQGHGVIVLLSSVAGQRPRRSNFVYGSTKAGADAFYVGLGEALREHGGRVLVVRPGFVRSRMTAGMTAVPLATVPAEVARAVVDAVRDGRDQIWVPSTLRAVMWVLQRFPRAVFRRLPI